MRLNYPSRLSAAPRGDRADDGRSPAGGARRAEHALVVAGWGALTAFVLITAQAGGTMPHVHRFQAAYLAGFAGYAALLVLLVRRGGALPGAWRWWFIGAVLLRAGLLGTATSDDVYRYVWEGRVQRAGFSPYALAPDDARLALLRDSSWGLINHRDCAAIYPPLAELEFRALAAIRATPRFFKFVHVAWDALTMAAVAAWLRSMGRAPHAAVVYGLCPLVLTAFGVEGHVDSLMLLLLALAAWASNRRRWYAVAPAVAGAALVKLAPIVLLPFLLRRRPAAAALGLAIVLAGYGLYAPGVAGLFDNLRRFAGQTACFGSIYPVLAAVSETHARTLAAVGVLIVLGWRLWRDDDFASYSRAALAAIVLFAPIVHYWYVTWVLLFLATALRVSWVVLSAGMVTYFAAQHARVVSGAWSMPVWAAWVAYAPFAVVWLTERLARRRATPPTQLPARFA